MTVTMQIADVAKLLHELGQLHDARIQAVVWTSADRRLDIQLADLFSNFLGLPEYSGPAPATISFAGVSELQWELRTSEDVLRVLGTEISETEGRPRLTLSLWFGGRLSIDFDHIQMACAPAHASRVSAVPGIGRLISKAD